MMDRSARVDAAITIDEVGIETGHYGAFLLKSAYQPVFRREGADLAPVGAKALVAPLIDGVAQSHSALQEATRPEDLPFIKTMCAELHLRNYANLYAPWLDLFVGFEPETEDDPIALTAEVRLMVGRLRELGIDPRRLVCDLAGTAEIDHSMLAIVAAEMRLFGIRIAIGDGGTGRLALERVDLVRPDFVTLDGSWFGDLAGVGGAPKLLAALVRGLRELGARVLVNGVETPLQLEAALAAGVDLLQGSLMARPALAGTILQPPRLAIRNLIDPGGNVVRLRG